MKMNIASPFHEPTIVMSRTFDAPREVVWTAFTTPKHVGATRATWSVPASSVLVHDAIDVREGAVAERKALARLPQVDAGRGREG
jgi:uncharacterized protein YndB with AHSA1/START domain